MPILPTDLQLKRWPAGIRYHKLQVITDRKVVKSPERYGDSVVFQSLLLLQVLQCFLPCEVWVVYADTLPLCAARHPGATGQTGGSGAEKELIVT